MNENLNKAVEALKAAIAEHPSVTEYLAAQQAYIADNSLITKTSEYNVQRQVYETESAKEEKDEQLLESVKARLEALYGEISSSETARRLIEAEDDVNEFYNEIFGELQSVVNPHAHCHDDGCGGDCSACGGCH